LRIFANNELNVFFYFILLVIEIIMRQIVKALILLNNYSGATILKKN